MGAEEQLRRAAERYARERAKLDEQEIAVTGRRDSAVRAAASAGLSRRRIAAIFGDAQVKVTHQRVQQIVRGTR